MIGLCFVMKNDDAKIGISVIKLNYLDGVCFGVYVVI